MSMQKVEPTLFSHSIIYAKSPPSPLPPHSEATQAILHSSSRANVGHDDGGSFVQPNLGDHNVHDENVDVERMRDHSADSHVNQKCVDSELSCDEEHEDNNDDDKDGVGISDFDEMYNEQGRENTS
ncbi:hypothetical protein DH2020_024393 [Rehmannia glutinosa]|uniref:Uncharacterized protein n=1 Tax=Rehmannia glutinosa TaxID=99300 RepID=A0ABR0W6A0_REHGL